MLIEKEVEGLYKELLYESGKEVLDGQQTETALGSVWTTACWDDREDCITDEEWRETLAIHKVKRTEQINKLLKGYKHGS